MDKLLHLMSLNSCTFCLMLRIVRRINNLARGHCCHHGRGFVGAMQIWLGVSALKWWDRKALLGALISPYDLLASISVFYTKLSAAHERTGKTALTFRPPVHKGMKHTVSAICTLMWLCMCYLCHLKSTTAVIWCCCTEVKLSLTCSVN